MQLKNNYYYFQSLLTPEICDKIISSGEDQIKYTKSQGVSTEARTAGNNQKKSDSVLAQNDKTVEDLSKEVNLSQEEIEKKSYVRDSEIAWFNVSKYRWIYDLIIPRVQEANRVSGWQYDIDEYEDIQFTKYHPGGFYGWHSDGGGDHYAKYKKFIDGIHEKDDNGNWPQGYTSNSWQVGKVRKISVTINLNKPGEYEGGNLKFDFGPHNFGERYKECDEIRPQGSMIIFPSFLHHQVTPVTTGTRYSLVLWCLGKPFR